MTFVASLCGASTAQGQIGLPSTPSTSAPSAPNASQPHPASTASVNFQNGLLTVTAHDVSLNGILRQISQQTGMRISGTVRDDRVFGTYGPDRPSIILSTLLDGTGVNVIFVNSTEGRAEQLVLSPRTGAPTPPSQFADTSGSNQEQDSMPPSARPPNQSAPPPLPIYSGRAPQRGTDPGSDLSSPTSNNSDSQAVVFPSVSATTTPATATTSSDVTQQQPAGQKTPQEIFQQLQQLRQQQEQTDPGTAPQ